MKLLAAALALLSLPACAQTQTWVKLGMDGISIHASAGTFRYGAIAGPQADICDGKTIVPEGWATKTLAADASFTADQTWFGTDPAYCRYKEIDILQTDAPQTVTVNGNVITIPALPPPPPPPPPPVTVLSSWSFSGCYLDINSDGTAKIRNGCMVTKK